MNYTQTPSGISVPDKTDVIILAGGYGSRMGRYGKITSKALFPLDGQHVTDYANGGGQTFLDYLVDWVKESKDVDRTIVTVNGLHHDPQFKPWYENRGDPKIVLLNEGHRTEEESEGAIWSLYNALDKTGSDCRKLVLACDGIIDNPAQALIDYSREKQSTITCVYDVEDLEEAKNLGIVLKNDYDKITDFEEKPDEPKSTLASIAMYVFPQESLPRVEDYLNSGGEARGIGRFLQWLHKEEPVYGFPVGTFIHLTDISSWRKAQKEIKELESQE